MSGNSGSQGAAGGFAERALDAEPDENIRLDQRIQPTHGQTSLQALAPFHLHDAIST